MDIVYYYITVYRTSILWKCRTYLFRLSLCLKKQTSFTKSTGRRLHHHGSPNCRMPIPLIEVWIDYSKTIPN